MTLIDRRYSVAEGTAVKAPCLAATTANITLSGLQTIDGVTVAENDRVLVKNQTTASQNGIYSASTGSWTRTRDFDGAYDIVTGSRIFVTAGTVNNGSEFYVSTTGTITIDSTSITISQMPAGLIGTSVAAASASASAASSSASAASSSASAASSSASAASSSASAAASSAAAAQSRVYASRAALAAATVGSTVLSTTCNGYTTEGDCAPISFARATSQPAYGGVRSTDRLLPDGSTDNTNGGWWGYLPGPAGVDVRAFGYVADWAGTDGSATDNTTPLQNAINFAALSYGTGFDTGGGGGSDVLLPSGSAMIGSNFIVHNGVQVIGKGVQGTVLVMKATFSTSSHFCRLGTPGDVAAVCASQSKGSAGNLTINGTNASGGVATFLAKTQATIYSSGNDTGITFTITGTNGSGSADSEVVTGSNASSATSAKYWLTITQVAASGATAGTVTVGIANAAAFGSRLEKMQLFGTTLNATSGKAMVYTDNAQHTAGLKEVKIFGGNRHCAFFEIGYGGAACFKFEDVETFNHGNASGVASNNSQIKLNYGGLLTSVRNIEMGGPGSTGGAGAVGMEILGGLFIGNTIHSEGIATGILIAIPNVNEGMVQISNANGSSNTPTFIHIDSVTDIGTVVVSGISGNGASVTIKNDPGSASITGNVIPWTTY